MRPLKVLCILVNRHNFTDWWPFIKKSLEESDFIAIDLEFSGLGSKDPGASNQIDDRYNVLRDIASTRAILSMGLACFKVHGNKGFFVNSPKSIYDQIKDCLDQDETGELNNNTPEEEDNDIHLTVDVFNFICMCQNDFMIEPKSMEFLIAQGFDFNELPSSGIPYYRGTDASFDLNSESPSLRLLLANMIHWRIPIVFHNGLHDIAFLYQSFYSELPKKVSTFLSDLHEMFPNGMYDTKFIYTTNHSASSSYLEYLFNLSQRKNYYRELRHQTRLTFEFNQFPERLSSDLHYFDLTAKIMQQTTENKPVCDNYAKYGWCEKQDSCLKSHNIDLILDNELKFKKEKRSKALLHQLVQIGLSQPYEPDQIAPMRKLGSHHSGNDAFMTGYCFIFYILTNFNKTTKKEFLNFSNTLKGCKNKIFLSGRTQALTIMKSVYACTSKAHDEKIRKIIQYDNGQP